MVTHHAAKLELNKLKAMFVLPIVFALLCLIGVQVHAQQGQSANDIGDILLEVDSWEGETDARFIAIYNAGSLFRRRWDDTLSARISNGNPYTLYSKGNLVGKFSVEEVRIDEEEHYVFISGNTTLFPEMSHTRPDSFGHSLMAISNGGSLRLPCSQPAGFTRERFLLDIDCDERIDSIYTHIAASSGRIELILATGISESVDSFTTAQPLEGLHVEDIFDLDADGLPEIFTMQYVYPKYGYVVYKKAEGKWERWLQAFGFGD